MINLIFNLYLKKNLLAVKFMQIEHKSIFPFKTKSIEKLIKRRFIEILDVINQFFLRYFKASYVEN